MGKRKREPKPVTVAPVQAPNRRPKTHRYISLSRWSKNHRERLQSVNFGAPKPDRNWRKKKAYDYWRRSVLVRDGHRCTSCTRQRNITVHHIIPAAVAPELRYEVFNGQTLCDDCHRKQKHQQDPEFWVKMITRRPK